MGQEIHQIRTQARQTGSQADASTAQSVRGKIMTELNRTALEAAHAAAMYEVGSHIHEGAISAAIRAYVAASPQPANPAQVTDNWKRDFSVWLKAQTGHVSTYRAYHAGRSVAPPLSQPANPAQVTEAMVEAAISAYNTCNPGSLANREQMRAALTAAIGAGGQAVKPLDLSNLLKHAFSAGYVSAAGDDGWTDYDPAKCAAYVRILSALSQPHPADERVVEDGRIRIGMEEILKEQSERDIPFAPVSAKEGR